jgi:dienelactone hydrolase
MTIQIDGFTVSSMTFLDRARDVYRRGTGPGVVVMHEAPGITPAVARFARTLADAGFTVFMPALFGTPGREMSVPYTLGTFASVCVRREIHMFAGNHSSPVTDWLRALCSAAHAELGGPGVGAIGMCMTGNFALALMVEPSMIAPVLSQPSLPVALSRRGRAALHLSDDELEVVKRRGRDEGVPVLAMRFTHDILCPGERFTRLREELGDQVELIEIDSSPGNPHGLPRTAHSVVTRDLVDQDGHPTKVALDRVLSFFRERLVLGSPTR